MARYALLIGNSRYPEDPGLDALRFPEHDVDALAAVLEAPERGGFEQVLTLKNAPHHQILRQVHQLLIEAGRDHLVLIYFSGHGLLDDAGQLYLAAADTARRWLATSAVAVNRIRELVDQTGNRQAVLILDCCHAGAIGQGFKGETTEVSLQHAAGVGEPPGRGMYILAASTAIQTAKEKETDANGLYTKHLIAGIRTGEADFNQDGWIGIDELHRYVREQVLTERPVQEPRLWGLDVGDPPVIAKSGREPRKEREQQVRKRLFDLAGDGYIPDDLLDQAKFIAGKPVDALTPLEQRLDPLLDALIKEELALGAFIRDWFETNRTAGNASSSPSSSISEFYQWLLLAKTGEDFHRLGHEVDQYLEKHPNDPEARMLKDRITRVYPRFESQLPDDLPAKTSPRAKRWFPWWLVLLILLIAAIAATWYWRAEVTGFGSGQVFAPTEKPAMPPRESLRPTRPVGSTFRDPLKDGGEGPEMVMIPVGEFLMGSPDGEVGRDSDERQHAVTIEQPFAMGKYEVTFADYDRFAEAIGRELPNDRGWGRGKRPVINVSWHDAVAYADWLSDQTGHEYRLPTETEWEYTARAGTLTPFHTDECIHTDQANYDGNYDYADCGAKTGVYRQQTVPVGSLPANSWGLHEVHGNVWEWTCSEYDSDYGGAETRCASRDSDERRAVRGGSWGLNPRRVRSADRDWVTPVYRFAGRGFRLARSP